MGIAADEISGHGKEWRIHHDGKSENVYETKEAASVAAASLAMRAGYEIEIALPASDAANTS
jgi:hypothetical protein